MAEADDACEGPVACDCCGDGGEARVEAGVFVGVVFAAPPGVGVGVVVVGGGGGEAGDVVGVEFEWGGGVDQGEVREGFVEGFFEGAGLGVEEGAGLGVACCGGERVLE